MTVEGGRLRADEPDQPCDVERWITPFKVDEFDKEFSESVRYM